MGIPKELFFNDCKVYFDSAKNILELGAQHYLINNNVVGYFKQFFNYPITSIDLNGENGSLKINLATKLPSMPTYDLITNFGTTEHVSNQYQCWKNVHSLLEDNGIVISEIPEIDSWKNHCKYYVDKRFFESMNKDFEILSYKQIYYPGNGNLCFCIMKKISKEFGTTEEELMKYVKIVEENNDKISF
jgi:hypothetical protein